MPSNPVDSHSNIIADLTLLVGGVAYDIPAHEFVQSLEVDSAADGAWLARLVLMDAREELEDLLVAAGQKGKLLFRWGWDGPGGIEALPLYTSSVFSYRPTFTPQGAQYELSLLPDLHIASILDRRVRGWPEGTELSSIVRAIAKARGYSTKDDRGRETVQATKTLLPDALSQMGETDIKFMRDYVVPYAVDEQGRGGFQVFVDRGNALHFHNDYFVPTELAARYVAYRDVMGEVIEFSPDNAAIFASMVGAGSTVYQGADSDGGVRAEVLTDLYKGVPGVANTVLEDAGSRVDLGKKTHARVSFYERDPVLFAARVASQYAMMSRLAYTARLVVRGTHAVQAGDYVAVDYFRRNGTKHYLSGNFLVKKVLHHWSCSGWTTDFDLVRDGLSDVTGTVPTGAQQQIAVQETGRTQSTGQSGSGNDAVGVEDHPVRDDGTPGRR